MKWAARRLLDTEEDQLAVVREISPLPENRSMSRIVEEPPVEPVRSYFSKLCVILTGVASGMVEPTQDECTQSSTFQLGRRDGYHVVVAHLASSHTLREAADKCVAFGRGVEERAETHPYGAEWCHGFFEATNEAATDVAMYAAAGTLPTVDAARLRAARAAARNVSPLAGVWPTRPANVAPPRSHREW